MGNKMFDDAVKIFEKANENFLLKNKELLENQVSERTLCGALMIALHDCIKDDFGEKYINYFVDVEYNRCKNDVVKHCVKTAHGPDDRIVKINCDLIVHGRGLTVVPKDNFIVVEMKKSTRTKKSRDNDRQRLQALTSSNDVYSSKGVDSTVVCGYILGVYYEINYKSNNIVIEYYKNGMKQKSNKLSIEKLAINHINNN